MTGSTHAVAGAPPMDTDSAPSGSLEGIEGWSHCRTRSQPGHGTSEGGACQVCIRRDPLVGSDKHPSIIQSFFAGTTSVPLRPFGGTCLSGPHINVRLSTRLQWARQACPSAVQRMPWQASRQCPRAPRRCFRGFGRAQCFQNLQSLVGLKVQAIISACGLLISRASHSRICCRQGPVH